MSDLSDLISFRPLAESDIGLLYRWLNLPHMRLYYEPAPITIEDITSKYMPRITGQQETYCHLAVKNGAPFGYLQCYKNIGWPEYAIDMDLTDGVSIDLYIGEPELVGKGWGRAMLRKYLETVVFNLFPQEHRCYIWHNVNNVGALNCSKAVGFKHVRELTEKGVLGELLVWEKV